MKMTMKDILEESVVRIVTLGETFYAKPIEFTEKYIRLKYISKEEADALIAKGWPVYDRKGNVPIY